MQSRIMSLLESIANVFVGFGVAVLTQVLVFPLFGLHASFAQNIWLGVIFTAVSLARSYALRRLFNTSRQEENPPMMTGSRVPAAQQ